MVYAPLPAVRGTGRMVLIVLVALSCMKAAAAWTTSTATFYGNEPWYWDIHQGSCGYGYIRPDQGTGWDVAALADASPDYSGSCGRCYEVQCVNSDLTDGYGQKLSRNGMCRDSGASIIVRTTDTCPCNYPGNAYSNKRWCCRPHLDLSVWAFSALSDQKWGVIPVRYRPVDCNYKPSKQVFGDPGSFPGVFPSTDKGKSLGLDWYRYYPSGGYVMDGGHTKKISTAEYVGRVGGKSGGSGQPQYGKK